jgi:aspartate-semialdehyde dehydrogenase
MGRKTRVAILGATGAVGQRFVSLLADHPWFEIGALAASDRSAGRAFGDVAPWILADSLPPSAASRVVDAAESSAVHDCPLVFSALDARVAGDIERSFADAGCTVVSNTRSHRMDPDVPLVVPEVNPDHLSLIEVQRERHGSPGAIATNPNCSTIGLVLALKPLVDAFGVKEANVVTMQAVSGAGLPGLPALHILDNVVPFIAGEEQKIEAESRKILGSLVDGRIRDGTVTISAQCNRVPIVDGHTLCVSVRLERHASVGDVREALESFSGEPQERGLPSAPERPILCLEEPEIPQPRLHRDLDGGMVTTVGRIRPCPILGFKFVVVTHNTLRGAARGALLVGELMCTRGLLT